MVQKIKNHRLLSFTLAVLLLFLVAFQTFVEVVSARYVKDLVLDNVITIPKNYYTVTYYQHDGILLDNVNVFLSTEHSLRNGENVTLPDGAESFIEWVNALGNEPDLTKREDYSLYPKFKYSDVIYEVRFMDMKGEQLLGSATFKESQAGQKATDVITTPLTAPDLTDLEFTGWGVRTDSGTVAWSDYTLSKADVVVYAQYEYNGELSLTPVDTDGDGDIDEYQVNSTSGLSGELRIPGDINGVPVAVVVEISDKGEINGLGRDGITKVIFEKGITTISSNALAQTADLKEVVIPSTVTKIGSNAFARTGGGTLISKTITVTYDGTWEQWLQITEKGWESGLTTGTTVICTDGTATLTVSGGILGYGATYSWKFVPNS